MQTKTFSVNDGTIDILENDHIYLFDKGMIATTEPRRYNTFLLDKSTLTRNPKTAEELAEEWGNKEYGRLTIATRKAFLAGRKSVSGEFHLTREELLRVYNAMFNYTFEDVISSLTPPIYPTTITVEHDGEKYLWETLKASYE